MGILSLLDRGHGFRCLGVWIVEALRNETVCLLGHGIKIDRAASGFTKEVPVEKCRRCDDSNQLFDMDQFTDLPTGSEIRFKQFGSSHLDGRRTFEQAGSYLAIRMGA